VQYAEAADAPNTLRATGATGTPSSLGAGTRASPPAGGARDGRAYLAAHAGTHAVATLRRRLVTLARAHRQAGIEGIWFGHPAIGNVMRGIARERGTAQCQAPECRQVRRLGSLVGKAPHRMRHQLLDHWSG